MSDNTSPQPTQSDLQRSYGSNWTTANMSTLSDWITIAAHNIQILTYAVKHYQTIIQTNIVVGLVLSTAAGTISTSQFTTSFDATTSMVLNGIFTFMTFTTAIVTGYIKMYHVQELLEECIRLKQEWVVFGSAIASELQLPTELRHDALYVITKNKNKYLDLLKGRPDVPDWCLAKAKKELEGMASTVNLDATNLAHTIMDIAKQEMTAIAAKLDGASQTSFMPIVNKNISQSKVQLKRDEPPDTLVLTMTKPLAAPTAALPVTTLPVATLPVTTLQTKPTITTTGMNTVTSVNPIAMSALNKLVKDAK